MKTLAGMTRRKLLKYLAACGIVALTKQKPVIATAAPRRTSAVIGVLLPLTGGMEGYAEQMRLGIETAVNEINGTGGVLGIKLDLVYADSETHPSILPVRCRELVEDKGAIAIIGPFVAAGRRYAVKYLEKKKIPLINATNHEGDFCSPVLFNIGPTTNQDGHALVRYLDEVRHLREHFMVGSYPSWQNSMFRQLRFPMFERGATVHGQALTSTEETDFRPIIRWIQETDANSVLFCVMRLQGQEFLRQANDVGLLERVAVGWIGLNDTLIPGLEASELKNVITTTPFVANDREPGVVAFVDRVHRQHGPGRIIAHQALTHYNAVKALASAWETVGEVGSLAGLEGLPGLTFDGPTGPITIDAENHHATMNVVVAEARTDGLRILSRLGRVPDTVRCLSA